MPQPRGNVYGHGIGRSRRVSAPSVPQIKEPEPGPEAPRQKDSVGEAAAAAVGPPMRESDKLIAALMGTDLGVAGAAVRPPLRPSLTKQLAQAVSGAEEVIAKLEPERDLLLRVPAQHFYVAECASTVAGDVCFFVDRATYKFQHLVQGRIDMIMYYEHMVNPVLDRAARQLVFHINKQLRHFLDDYSARNSDHNLTLGFRSAEDMAQFLEKVWPTIELAVRRKRSPRSRHS